MNIGGGSSDTAQVVSTFLEIQHGNHRLVKQAGMEEGSLSALWIEQGYRDDYDWAAKLVQALWERKSDYIKQIVGVKGRTEINSCEREVDYVVAADLCRHVALYQSSCPRIAGFSVIVGMMSV
ncbi:hypothetical protein J6590_056554 [Homalodisca vitripennis]|nr:hypothetical protein J6590_056554 [Homalodisca vitripennis]